MTSDWPAKRTEVPEDSLFAQPPSLACDAPRLNSQCVQILDRLRKGPATNKELAAISLKYTGRISDLRKSGYMVECYQRDAATGLSWYRLVTGPRPCVDIHHSADLDACAREAGEKNHDEA